MENLLIFTDDDDKILSSYEEISKENLENSEHEKLVKKYPALENEVLYKIKKLSSSEQIVVCAQLCIDLGHVLLDDCGQCVVANAQYEEKLAKLALQGQNPPSNATWITPVSGYTISSAFGMRIHPVYKYALMHNGIDMACPRGTPIYATRAGTVTTASYQAGGAGYYVSINHGDGFSSIYMHMTNYVVSSGQSVAAGQLIGYVGSTGVSTGPHLHFGVSYAGTYVNPMAYIG